MTGGMIMVTSFFSQQCFVERHTVEVSIVWGKNGRKFQVNSAWISQQMLYELIIRLNEWIIKNCTEKHAVVLCTYYMYGMLQRTSPQCYTVRTVNNYEHF